MVSRSTQCSILYTQQDIAIAKKRKTKKNGDAQGRGFRKTERVARPGPAYRPPTRESKNAFKEALADYEGSMHFLVAFCYIQCRGRISQHAH